MTSEILTLDDIKLLVNTFYERVRNSDLLAPIFNERIVIEAKRELYLTGKPVKQIAYELGFNDEFYFSRFFKGQATVSPQMYRDTVGYAVAER